MKQNTKKRYICQVCGSVQIRWSGQCNDCNEWNTLIEEKINNVSTQHQHKIDLRTTDTVDFVSLVGSVSKVERIDTLSAEMNRVLGSGLVPASSILIGGNPGIGKSTLLLSVLNKLSLQNIDCYYISGEESIDQIRLRAQRMLLHNDKISLATSTSVENIIASIKKQNTQATNQNAVLVIDSIQTMFVKYLDSSCGTISQLKASSHELLTFAKNAGIALLLVGHVTKDGGIAGPKLLEHMVDTVLYFEGEKGNQFRILRAVKNRFGPTNEIGIFEMKTEGLVEVSNPSSLFISNCNDVSGNVIFAGIEGTRPILAEVQALISQSYLPTPRRAVIGWDANRLAMIIAVLQSRYGLSFANKEVYLNIAGGLKIIEPALDLAVIVALISSIENIVVPQNTVIWGEVGLSGEVRKVSNTSTRLKEAKKLGFTKAIIPVGSELEDDIEDIDVYQISHIRQVKKFFDQNQ